MALTERGAQLRIRFFGVLFVLIFEPFLQLYHSLLSHHTQ